MAPVGKTANDYIFSYAGNPAAASLFGVVHPVNGGAGLELDMGKPDLVRDAFYGDCSAADIRVATKNAVVISTSVPNVYAPQAIPTMPRHYIMCTEDHAIPLSEQKRMVEAVPGAAVHSLPTSHSPFFSAPGQLADLLKSIADD